MMKCPMILLSPRRCAESVRVFSLAVDIMRASSLSIATDTRSLRECTVDAVLAFIQQVTG